jgi:DNA polymerase III, delta subunit
MTIPGLHGVPLPLVLLLLAPDVQDAWLLGLDIFRNQGGVGYGVTSLTVHEAHYIVQDSSIRPLGGQKTYLIKLDGATEQAQNMLLKVLEEPPPAIRFILAASKLPLPTIVSRSQVHRLGMADRQANGPTPEEQKQRSVVASVLRAAQSHQPGLLSSTMRSWEPQHTRQLATWAVEAASGRWCQYDASFAPEVSKEQARKLLGYLQRYAGARTSAAVALVEVFAGS